MHASSKTRRWQTRATLSLLLEGGVIHHNISRDLIHSPQELIAVLKAMDHGCHPDVGTLTTGRGESFMLNDTAVFRLAFMQYVEECWLDAFIISLCVAYMGVTHPSSTLNDLMNCHMRGWNGKEVVHLSVLDHFPKFMSIIETLDQNEPFATNICALYQGVWYIELKHFANMEDYTILTHPMGESNAAARKRLQVVRDSVHQFEQKLSLLRMTSWSAASQYSPLQR